MSEEVVLRGGEEGKGGTWALGSKPEIFHAESKSKPSGEGGAGNVLKEDRKTNL